MTVAIQNGYACLQSSRSVIFTQMERSNPEENTTPLSFPQIVEARTQFDSILLRAMLDFNSELLANASDPTEIAELTTSDQYLKDLLQRLES
ncbi:MAG: hypothetical protein NVSMB46_04170 [Candidatus Saccharimonadales bacterium]